ncbi:MAG: branched-chain-amino-acid transaminase [Candidatus Sumerlaeales bacterium]|nr:branched-chain-amino-acid transaminase [Candidatus Sumerlaeales bacterium]
MKIWIDGKLYEKEDAKISVFDHGLLYGDGIFEGIRAYNGNIFRLDQHLNRLWDGAKFILLDIPVTKQEMKDALKETLKANNLKDAYIRLVVTRGVGDLGLDPHKCKKGTVIIITSNISLYPAEVYEKGMQLATVPTQRFNVASWNARVKSLNYLNNIMAKLEGHQAGVPEVLMLDSNGYVVECSADNFFIVKDNKLFAPPQYLGALCGITRDAIIDLAKRRNIEVREEVFTRFEVWTADECFLSGTAAEVLPVVKVDNRVIADGMPGKMTKQLISDFKAIAPIEGEKF